MKLFVISDVHGFYDEMIAALDKAGFDKENPEHWLISCGDNFDRGGKPLHVMKFLQNLPRKILVKGNHETLLVDCCNNGYPGMHDYSNGTFDTICELGGYKDGYAFPECCDRALSRTHLFLEGMVDYFETENHIFVHSWIPVKCDDNLPMHYTKNRKFSLNSDWRNASKKDWEQARWGNPFSLAEKGLFPDKTIVFGHWHASAGWAKSEGRSEFGDDAKFDVFYGDGFISIDACTAHTNKVNVLVLEDDFIDKGNEKCNTN